MKNKENGQQIYRLMESLYTHVTDLFAEQNGMMQKMNSDIRADMADMGAGLRGEMAGMETRLRGEMADMKDELRAEMTDMKTELRAEMADMKVELKEAITENGDTIKRLERETKKNAETLYRHDLDIQMLKKTFVQTG